MEMELQSELDSALEPPKLAAASPEVLIPA
jgi:hypothetical protein